MTDKIINDEEFLKALQNYAETLQKFYDATHALSDEEFQKSLEMRRTVMNNTDKLLITLEEKIGKIGE